MIYWLDSQLNTRTRPQENFGREIMELFSLGIGNYTEQDVYAAARVFTGFNWQIIGDRASTTGSYYAFQYRPNDHDVNAKEFTFPIYPNGSRVIPARAAAQRRAGRPGLHPRAGAAPGDGAAAGDQALQVLRQRDGRTGSGADLPRWRTRTWGTTTTSRPCCARWSSRRSSAIPRTSSSAIHGRSSSRFAPSRKPAGPASPCRPRLTPLANMGQQLYEPPDVNGWELGPGWISTSSMLTRMNFASTLAANQRFNLARDLQPLPPDSRACARIHAGALPDDGFPGDGDDRDDRLPPIHGVDRVRCSTQPAHSRSHAPDRRIRRVPVQLEEPP